tara:strand:+ start:1354 stop:1605 length:252 start_codon:yes stop_codon:yes gene_type:complete
MNARLAIEENERFIKNLFTDVKEFSESKCKTLTASLNFIVDLKIKWAKNDDQKAAWHLRGKRVEKMINQKIANDFKHLQAHSL